MTAADLAAIRGALDEWGDCCHGNRCPGCMQRRRACLAALARVEADTLTPERARLLVQFFEDAHDWGFVGFAESSPQADMLAWVERIAGDTGEAT